MTFDEMMVVSHAAAVLRGSADGAGSSRIVSRLGDFENRLFDFLLKTLRVEAASLQAIVDADNAKRYGERHDRD